jgi:hypothetical protein
VLSVRRRKRERFAASRLAVELAMHALEGLSAVKVLEGARHTGPNHSLPTSCIVDADIDAEDHPERRPQNGH